MTGNEPTLQLSPKNHMLYRYEPDCLSAVTVKSCNVSSLRNNRRPTVVEEKLLDEVDVRQDHTTAAVPLPEGQPPNNL